MTRKRNYMNPEGFPENKQYPHWVDVVPTPTPKPIGRNNTLIAMLVLKNPHCVYCNTVVTTETAELDKNDILGPALTCVRCNDRTK